MDFELPDGVSPEIADLFQKDEVKSIVAHINKGVADKNKELLGQLSLTKKEINELGGIDTIKQRITALAQLEADRKAKETEEATGSKDVETVKKAYQEKLDALAAERDALKQEKVASKVTSMLTRALGNDADAFDVLEPFIMKRVKPTVADDGSVKVQVLTSEGGPMLTEKGDATVKDLIAEFRDSSKFSPLFKAENKAGSGARTTTEPVVTENPFAKNTPHFSPMKQAALYKSDPGKAKALAAAAGVTLFE